MKNRRELFVSAAQPAAVGGAELAPKAGAVLAGAAGVRRSQPERRRTLRRS